MGRSGFVFLIRKGILFIRIGSAAPIMKAIAILVGIINCVSWFNSFGVIYTMLFLVYIDSYEKNKQLLKNINSHALETVYEK